MDADSEATADMEEAEAAGEPAAVDQPPRPVPLPATAAAAYMPDVSASVPASTRDMDYEADEDDDGASTESDGEQKAFAAVQAHAAMRASKPPTRRSRASSPDWQEAPTLEDRRLTARQRARLEKEAGLAEDVQWHEMAMPPELAYTWKGKGNKAPSQMTEEEWLKRQEGLERRRMRSLRDKREAEETIKAKLRKAVTARFRGKLGGGAGGGEGSGTEGEAGGGTRGTSGQESLIQPGWVKLRHAADGCSIAWHANAHPLSYPMAVAAPGSYPPDAVELPLQPPADAQQWRIPDTSSSSFKLGCTLMLQQQQQQQQQQSLCCVDSHGWAVGQLQQQQVLDALLAAGYNPAMLQQQCSQQQQQQQQQQPQAMHQELRDGVTAAAAAGSTGSMLQGWQAIVKSLRRSQDDAACLRGVVVRLVPTGGPG